MSGLLVATVVAVAVGLLFSYTNGFHDAANAIATSVSTRALSVRAALILAAVGNLAGSFLGGQVAETVGEGIVELPNGVGGLAALGCGLVAAVAWNFTTWYFGLPSSSSHALIAGLVGAAIPAAGDVHWQALILAVGVPLLLSPVVGYALAFVVMLGELWIFRRGRPSRLDRGFRVAQTCSAAAMSVGHGLQDAAKTIGVVTLALVLGGVQPTFEVPLWVYFAVSAMLALGTYSGGRRIIATLGRRVVRIGPPEGFAAEITASSILYVGGVVLGAPLSTTHTITGSIAGSGSARRPRSVRWNVAGGILAAWVLTVPVAGLLGALLSGLYLLFVT